MCCFYHIMQKLVANLIKLLSFIVLFNNILDTDFQLICIIQTLSYDLYHLNPFITWSVCSCGVFTGYVRKTLQCRKMLENAMGCRKSIRVIYMLTFDPHHSLNFFQITKMLCFLVRLLILTISEKHTPDLQCTLLCWSVSLRYFFLIYFDQTLTADQYHSEALFQFISVNSDDTVPSIDQYCM